ncbi:MAG: double-strand break repair protein AddB [Hyphomonadaceae bacterium]|nr:double-strand break repair protein AddB [Hyphomonadaceae bacterium]
MSLDLFGGDAPRVRAAPASAPFLDLIAEAMVEALWRESDPFALADALVLLPNRRAARGLSDAFARRLGGAALLPTIRPLGDVADEDNPDVWGADAAIDLELSPAIEATRQRMELAALIRARDRAAGGVEDPVRAIALADELRKLLESAATVDHVAWDKLPTLADEADLAQHWQSSAKFLDIVASYWPQRLAADGLCDPGARRADLIRKLAVHWEETQPERPIIIAGSTGSIAATRTLMRAVSRLPRGVVVLPGVDVELDDKSWDLIHEQHPQFALKQTLLALEVDRRAIAPLGEEAPAARARRVLMREALAPAEQTADWLARLEAAGGAAFVAEGAEGVRLIEAATENEEAAAIAVLLREALERGRTAALATPDADLARRVESKLARWGVAPVASHGRPLRQSEPGLLAALLCELADDPGEPVALAALMKHPRVMLARDGLARTKLEHEALRGPRRHETLADLAALDVLEKADRARALVQAIESALAPLTALMGQTSILLSEFAEALAHAAENCSEGEVWRGGEGERLANLLREIIEHGADLQPLAPYAAPRVLMRLMDGLEAPPASGGDPRIALWGPLEARLQRCDLMILGGLNEGVWPAPPGEDPFLSRSMRVKLGLPALDQRIGLQAHDFAQLANAPNVVLTRALRREGSPTLASRWLWRLQTLVKGAGAKLAPADEALALARALDMPTGDRRPIVPKPKPPADQRLTRISVTQVETLIRDPYAVYANRILGLAVLKPIGAPVGPAERGTAIHKAMERFEDDGDPSHLRALLDEELRRAGVAPDRRAAERSRLEQSVRMLIAWLKAREDGAVYREKKGVLQLECGVVLSGTADRIEINAAGGAILDFKTGSPPTDKQVESGLSPQLLLEAAMLARGAFEGVPAAQVHELIYWRFGGANPAPRIVAVDGGAHAAGEKALAELETLLRKYAEPDQAFLSKPRVQFIKHYADYDQLARRKEWADAEMDE